MPASIILASGSEIRSKLLTNAAIPHVTVKPRIDEESVKNSLLAEESSPRDVADCLAEMKARKVSEANPDALVIGCDQVLDLDRVLFSKPPTAQACEAQLRQLSGKTHKLHSAAVICEAGKPIWRLIGSVRMQMRPLSEDFIAAYVQRNWDSVQHSVGGYKLEEEGARLFTSVQGDYFHVLGLPLLEIISYLVLRGDLEN